MVDQPVAKLAQQFVHAMQICLGSVIVETISFLRNDDDDCNFAYGG